MNAVKKLINSAAGEDESLDAAATVAAVEGPLASAAMPAEGMTEEEIRIQKRAMGPREIKTSSEEFSEIEYENVSGFNKDEPFAMKLASASVSY